MSEMWIGNLSVQEVQAEDHLKIVGSPAWLRSLKSWFLLYRYADIQ